MYIYIPSIVIVIITTIGYHNHNARVPPELLVETHSFPFSGHKLASQLSCSPTVAPRAPSSFQWAAAWARWGELQSLVWQRNSERSKETLLVPEGKHKLTQTWPKSLFDAKRWLEDELLDQMWTDVEEKTWVNPCFKIVKWEKESTLERSWIGEKSQGLWWENQSWWGLPRFDPSAASSAPPSGSPQTPPMRTSGATLPMRRGRMEATTGTSAG